MKRKCCENVEINFTNYINVYYTSILHKSRMNRDKLAYLEKVFKRTEIEERISKIFSENEDKEELIKQLKEMLYQGGAMFKMEGGNDDGIVQKVINGVQSVDGHTLKEFKKAFVADAISRAEKIIIDGMIADTSRADEDGAKEEADKSTVVARVKRLGSDKRTMAKEGVEIIAAANAMKAERVKLVTAPYHHPLQPTAISAVDALTDEAATKRLADEAKLLNMQTLHDLIKKKTLKLSTTTKLGEISTMIDELEKYGTQLETALIEYKPLKPLSDGNKRGYDYILQNMKTTIENARQLQMSVPPTISTGEAGSVMGVSVIGTSGAGIQPAAKTEAERLAEEAEVARLAEEAATKRLAEEAATKRLADEAAEVARLVTEEAAEVARLVTVAEAKRLAEEAMLNVIEKAVNLAKLAGDELSVASIAITTMNDVLATTSGIASDMRNKTRDAIRKAFVMKKETVAVANEESDARKNAMKAMKTLYSTDITLYNELRHMLTEYKTAMKNPLLTEVMTVRDDVVRVMELVEIYDTELKGEFVEIRKAEKKSDADRMEADVKYYLSFIYINDKY